MDEESLAMTLLRIRQQVDDGRAPGPESSICKIAGSELKQRRWQLAVDIAGPAGIGWQGAGFDEKDLSNTRDWLRSRANTIEGGTTEIQLNTIASRVLGLPSAKRSK
jgi:alkylation response protein AidB-like acyl-CoA dehydrogenase